MLGGPQQYLVLVSHTHARAHSLSLSLTHTHTHRTCIFSLFLARHTHTHTTVDVMEALKDSEHADDVGMTQALLDFELLSAQKKPLDECLFKAIRNTCS